MTPIIVLD